tara:strand:+ start:114 stop:224 length:111 start_codon:yes stop_codon:yes gene_type:complete
MVKAGKKLKLMAAEFLKAGVSIRRFFITHVKYYLFD